MRHSILTCKNHPTLRWSCKSVAINEDAKPGETACYNGARNIFFNGTPTGKGLCSDGSDLDCTDVIWKQNGEVDRFVHECSCSLSDLLIAEEDALVKRPEPVVSLPLPAWVEPTDPALLQEIKDIMALPPPYFIQAVKHLRTRTGMGLFEAYKVIEGMVKS